ncbi:MAG: hypothetical protein M1831_003501 [Alyxoria varia]|nr:MAG: hypothetical protein M1831_003501 [Alyxoria varia]
MARGPFSPQVQSLGNPPEGIPDAPASAVFLALFIFLAASHMRIFKGNKAKGHLFVFSGAMFGFCMARIVACILRIAWAYEPNNLNLAIADQVFVAAGVVIMYIINLFFVQRLMKARHPHIGWSKPFRILIPPVLFVLTIVALIMIIVATIQSQFTQNPNTHRIDRDIQLTVNAFFCFVAFIPIPLILAMLTITPRTHMDKFGSGRFSTKVIILVTSSALLTLGVGFRTGTAAVTPVSVREPIPWYFSKACFYIFNFGLEVLVLLFYLVVRVDRRFWVPNGAEGPGSYSHDLVQEKPKEWDTETVIGNQDRTAGSTHDGQTTCLQCGNQRVGPSHAGGANGHGSHGPVPPPKAAHVHHKTSKSEDADGFSDAQSVRTNRSSVLGVNAKTGEYEMQSMPPDFAGAIVGRQVHEGAEPPPGPGRGRGERTTSDLTEKRTTWGSMAGEKEDYNGDVETR